mmetsp:Transcript_130076/g.259461  ORF Transcript_130076/g.259461 Transcript_130076/m.259461 type:complete len:202 (+) Transcript_130076:703-1308(+)
MPGRSFFSTPWSCPSYQLAVSCHPIQPTPPNTPLGRSCHHTKLATAPRVIPGRHGLIPGFPSHSGPRSHLVHTQKGEELLKTQNCFCVVALPDLADSSAPGNGGLYPASQAALLLWYPSWPLYAVASHSMQVGPRYQYLPSVYKRRCEPGEASWGLSAPPIPRPHRQGLHSCGGLHSSASALPVALRRQFPPFGAEFPQCW